MAAQSPRESETKNLVIVRGRSRSPRCSSSWRSVVGGAFPLREWVRDPDPAADPHSDEGTHAARMASGEQNERKFKHRREGSDRRPRRKWL